MLADFELRELRVFLVLADELHFGRAAQQLHLTPSRVSQCLRALECKLGSCLVHRTSRRVELTAFGERFRDEAIVVYQELIALFERARAASGSFEEPFRLGILHVGIEGPELPAIVHAFERCYPECQVQVIRPAYGEVFEALRRSAIDALVSWLPLQQSDLVVGPVLSREPRLLAVAYNHALAKRSQVSIEDVADYETLGTTDEVFPKEMAEAFIPTKTPEGRLIRRRPILLGDMARRDASQVRLQQGLLISSGKVVLPVVPGVKTILGPNIAYIPIRDMPPLRRALVWKRGTTDARIRAFIAVTKETLRSRAPEPSAGRR